MPTTLPAAAYTSNDILQWELRHLFAGPWTCVGRTDDVLPDGSTQRAAVVISTASSLPTPPPICTSVHATRTPSPQLEGGLGELPGVLPLPADPSRAVPGIAAAYERGSVHVDDGG